MNKQQKTYILLGAVLIIWGIIGYQFLGNFSPNTAEVVKTSSLEFIPKKITHQKGYTVLANYRDPFLGKIPAVKKKSTKRKKKAPKIKTNFPNIIYNGVFEGSSKSFLLTINREQEIMVIGQTFKKVTLKSADKIKIKVLFNSEIKTIQLLE